VNGHPLAYPQLGAPPVLLAAGFPAEHEEDVPAAQLLEIEEAVLSLTRAAFAQGRRIVLPADRIVAPLVAEIATEYALPPRTEEVERSLRSLVVVAFTSGHDDRLQEALAELGDVVEAAIFPAAEERQYTGRHRITRDTLELGASRMVVIGGEPGILEDLELARERGLEQVAIGPTLVGAALEANLEGSDVVRRLLAEVGAEEGRWDAGAGEPTPYPFVMQRLLADWAGEEVGHEGGMPG
jgi:hypothetical protein